MIYTKFRSKDKLNLLQTATVEQIREHTDQVRQGVDPCILPHCPRCGLTLDFFKRHEKRSRKFYIIVDLVVTVLQGLLSRWKCPGCNKTTTSYPSFALPYKRYTLPTIRAFNKAYVQNQAASYRNLVAACPLVYERPPESDSNQESAMEHSTLAGLL